MGAHEKLVKVYMAVCLVSNGVETAEKEVAMLQQILDSEQL